MAHKKNINCCKINIIQRVIGYGCWVREIKNLKPKTQNPILNLERRDEHELCS
jgi:hypothetical protein